MAISLSAGPAGETPGASRLADAGALRGAVVLTVLTLAVFGFLYSLAGVGIGQALFAEAADGSLIEREGNVMGSALVAQPFVGERYFQPRPSAAGYNPMALAGSNQARTNPDMRKRIEEARAAVAQRDGVPASQVPGELVTQSGSGIDPHLSPGAVAIQVERVARSRGLARNVVQQLVADHTEGKQFVVFGQPRVNVLALNLALDRMNPPSATPHGRP